MTNPTSWRRALRIHPAADLFPMMHEDELLALGQDIEKNTLREPIVCFEGQLLDGRNRLDAMESVGMKLVAGNGEFNWAQVPTRDVTGCDPYEFVASANIHRRHLTAEQKRELVEKLIKAEPTRSDRQIAEQIKSNRTTVGQIRKRLEKAGDVSIVDTRTDRKGRQQPATKPPTRAVTAAAVRAEERAAKAAPQTDQEIEPSPSPQQPKEESPAPPRSATGAANKPDQMGVAHDTMWWSHASPTCMPTCFPLSKRRLMFSMPSIAPNFSADYGNSSVTSKVGSGRGSRPSRPTTLPAADYTVSAAPGRIPSKAKRRAT